jgi:3-dehydroquinate synthase
VVTRSFEQAVEQLLELIGDAHVAVITDETVAELYGPVIVGALAKSGLEPELATVPAGERHKTPAQALELLDWLTGTRVGRRDVILALGGGVVIDMAGFVSTSCYSAATKSWAGCAHTNSTAAAGTTCCIG